MNEKPNYYAVIPAEVRYNENLNSSQKLFYGEITALTYKTGECWASNTYFAKLYNVSPSLITNWLKALEKEQLIAIEYERKGQEIVKRIIKIKGIQNIEQVFNKSQEGYSKYLKENNTSNNITSNKKEIYKEKRFIKPTLEEVQNYCMERNNNIDAEYFIDFYESKGWLVGKTKMKDWKACIRTWENKNKKTKKEEIDWEAFFKEVEEREKNDNTRN